ncbi:hypothetical protein [Catenulispora yoronensis]
MQSRTFRLGAATAALALGAGLGSGTAAASTATSAHHAPGATIRQVALVLSDTIKFSGTATPTGSGNYTLTTNTCTLTSDGETPVYPCTVNLTFSLATLTGTIHVMSPDGIINGTFRMNPGPVAMSYTLTGLCTTGGVCYEIDQDDPTPMYPFDDITGNITLAPIAGTPNFKVTATVNIWEDPSKP